MRVLMSSRMLQLINDCQTVIHPVRSRHLVEATFPYLHFKQTFPCYTPVVLYFCIRCWLRPPFLPFIHSFIRSFSNKKKHQPEPPLLCDNHTIFIYHHIIPSSNLCPSLLDYKEESVDQERSLPFPMDATLSFRSTPRLSGGRYGLSSSNLRRRHLESRQATPLTSSPCNFDVSAKVIRSRRSVVPSFADDGHATYYQTTPRATCGDSFTLVAKKTTKDRGGGGIKGRHSESKELKKKLKRVEGLLRSIVSTMVFVDEEGEAASFAHDRVLAVSKSVL